MLDVYHIWLLEDLPGGRVRILTQEIRSLARSLLSLESPKEDSENI
jgi:hypothetical protein